MPLLEIPRDPPRRHLLLFGALLLPFVALAGWLVSRHAGSPAAAYVVWIAGGALWLVFAAVPRTRRPIWVGWMTAVFPVGWVLSHVVVVAFYYLVLTPIALVLRLFGHDAMRRRRGAARGSYWVERRRREGTRRYFRQY
jgi:saxitoxin biosynthesis operon SxtJ-like protein